MYSVVSHNSSCAWVEHRFLLEKSAQLTNIILQKTQHFFQNLYEENQSNKTKVEKVLEFLTSNRINTFFSKLTKITEAKWIRVRNFKDNILVLTVLSAGSKVN